MNKINFREVKDILRGYESKILYHILPGGKKEINEYVVLNPTRNDKKSGSFRINTLTWKWADFATNDRGGDIISLYAYVKGITQLNAAKELLNFIGRTI